MTELVVFLSTRKKNWAYVSKLVKEQKWSKVIIVTNEFRNEMLQLRNDAEIIPIDSDIPLVDLAEEIQDKLEGKINGIEVAVNFVHGNGKEHMALMSSLLKLGIGIRFVALKPGGMEEI